MGGCVGGELSERATEKMGFSRTVPWQIFISLEEKVREWRQIREHRRQARVFSLLPGKRALPASVSFSV